MLKKKQNNINIFLIFLSFSIFFSKWFFSFYEYGLENLFNKFLFNPSGDHSYYPFVHQLSNFILNEGYSTIVQKNSLIGFPFMVILIHSIFYKLFGVLGFLILELVCIFVFLKIFYLLFKELDLNDIYCVLIAFTLFSLFALFSLLNEFNIPYAFNLKQFYSGFYTLRFPRPLITNLFFFSSLLFLIRFFLSKTENIKNKNLLISFIFLGLVFSSFFYFFVHCSILVLLLIIYEYKFIDLIKNKIYLLIKCFLLFLLISSLFIIQIIFIEDDYLLRIGTIKIDFEIKKYLFEHLLRGFLKLEFLIIFFSNILLYFINIKLNYNFKKFLIFFILLFISSILSPIFYIVLMNKVTFFSNFIFIITLSSLLLLKVNLILFLYSVFKNFYTKLKFNTIFTSIIIILIFSVNVNFFKKNAKVRMLSEGVHFTSDNIDKLRNNFIDLTSYARNKLGKNKLLLTNDLHTQLWWIFSNEKKFYFPYVFFVALNDQIIEKQLINAFKILKFNELDFINYFNQNKVTNWRIVNTNNYFFLGHLKYQANYLKLNDSIKDYPFATHKFINKKSIHHTNQVILSNKETTNLKEKFLKSNIDQNLQPDLIILLKDNFIEKNIYDLKNYLIIFENSNYVMLEIIN
jgi:hypothetical protein